MQPNVNTPVATQPTASFDKQLADIKSQAASIVSKAQKADPNIKISAANAEMIGLPKVEIPTERKKKPTPSELSMVGTTPSPKTNLDIARESILNSVAPEDRDTIDQILQVSTGLQTERGTQLEGTMDSILTQQLANIKSTRDRALETSSLKEAARIPELEAELESIRSEADVLEARRNSALQAEARRTGVSTSAQQGNLNAIDRDFNLEKANLAIRELASVGKINAATKLIDTKLDLKYGDLEAESELLTAQINAIKPFLDREDAKAADMRLQLNEIVKSKITEAREADKALEEFKLQSYIFAQQNGASPAVLSSIMSSTSREDVASVGGTFIQDPMQKLQMQKTKADIAQGWENLRINRERFELEQSAAGNLYGTIDGKPQNATQALVGGYANRLLEANTTISSSGNTFASKTAFGGILPSFVQTAERQQFEQAKRNFINAVLRRESGAVIADSEFSNAEKQYFPQPGDAPATVLQKAQNRNTVINNFYNEANMLRPVSAGDIVESQGKKYRVEADGITLTEI